MDGVSGPQLRHAGLNLSDDPRRDSRQVESDVFGFWIFLMSDAVLFALLFAIYGTMLGATAGAPGPAQEFKIGSAFIETLLLLTVLLHLRHGVDRAEAGPSRQDALVLWLVADASAFGLAFLAWRGTTSPPWSRTMRRPTAAASCPPSSCSSACTGCTSRSARSGSIVMLLQLAIFGPRPKGEESTSSASACSGTSST